MTNEFSWDLLVTMKEYHLITSTSLCLLSIAAQGKQLLYAFGIHLSIFDLIIFV